MGAMKDDWIDAASLIELAAKHDFKVRARSLELWRYRGLLPRGEQPTGRAAWLYPPVSKSQLLRLLHWREKTRSLDLILIALWIEGFKIDIADARASLRAFVDAWEREMTRELDGAGDVSTAIEVLARKFAGKRGKAALPRVARMTMDERIRACAYALAFAFNDEDEIARRKGDAVLLERMLGLRTGRGGGLATVMPLDEDTLRQRACVLPARSAPCSIQRQMMSSSSSADFFTWSSSGCPCSYHSSSSTSESRPDRSANSQASCSRIYRRSTTHSQRRACSRRYTLRGTRPTSYAINSRLLAQPPSILS